jgi:YVTN family beta-propeller protein
MKTTFALLAILFCAMASISCSKGSAPTAPRQQEFSTLVFVTNEASGDLSVIDAVSHKVIATVALGKRPRGIHLTPDRKHLLVALSGSPFAPPGVDESTLPPPDKTADGIAIVDTNSNTLLKLLPGGSDPEEFAISADGSRIYVANEDVGLASLVEISSGAILKSLPVGEEPEGVSLSPDGKFVYVTSENDGQVSVIETASNNLLTTLKVGRRPRVVAFLPDGSRAYVSLENDSALAVVDPVKHTLLRTIRLQGEGVKPMGIAVAPDGKKIYVTTGRFGKVFAIDVATEQVIASVDAGARPWGIAITPDGKTLYTANGPSNDVAVIDTATLQVTAKISVGDRPWGIAILSR